MIVAAEQKKIFIKDMFKKQNDLLFDSLLIAETFKYYSSLAENLVPKLPKPPNNFGMKSVYKKWNLVFAKIESNKVFKILKKFGES